MRREIILVVVVAADEMRIVKVDVEGNLEEMEL